MGLVGERLLRKVFGPCSRCDDLGSSMAFIAAAWFNVAAGSQSLTNGDSAVGREAYALFLRIVAAGIAWRSLPKLFIHRRLLSLPCPRSGAGLRPHQSPFSRVRRRDRSRLSCRAPCHYHASFDEKERGRARAVFGISAIRCNWSFIGWGLSDKVVAAVSL